MKAGKCMGFTYGGCQGNSNNFASLHMCQEACEEDPCKLDIVPGPCRGAIKKFGFKDGKCGEFIYGGCQGNANNFASLEMCQKRCGPVYPKKCPEGCQNWFDGCNNCKCTGGEGGMACTKKACTKKQQPRCP